MNIYWIPISFFLSLASSYILHYYDKNTISLTFIFTFFFLLLIIIIYNFVGGAYSSRKEGDNYFDLTVPHNHSIAYVFHARKMETSSKQIKGLNLIDFFSFLLTLFFSLFISVKKKKEEEEKSIEDWERHIDNGKPLKRKTSQDLWGKRQSVELFLNKNLSRATNASLSFCLYNENYCECRQEATGARRHRQDNNFIFIFLT